LAGYVTLIADKLDLDQPILIDEGVRYQTFPAIKIGLLAADKRAKGAGRRLVEWSIEEKKKLPSKLKASSVHHPSATSTPPSDNF
jgi:hypothetical protein